MTSSITHILVPTDFSAFSNRAFRFASTMAKKVDARLTLFHVVEPPYNFATVVSGMIEMMEKNALSRMEMMIEESGTDLDVKTEVVHGRTTREILEHVDQYGIDMVVMGSRGQSALARAVMGSVSKVAAQELPVPLFLIPDRSELDSPELSLIVFTTDFKESDLENYHYAKKVAKLFDAELKTVHFTPAQSFNDTIRHAGFTKVLRESSGEDSVEVELLTGDNLLKSLTAYIDRQRATALVFNRYDKTALQTLVQKDHTSEMVLYSETPLLILPSG